MLKHGVVLLNGLYICYYTRWMEDCLHCVFLLQYTFQVAFAFMYIICVLSSVPQGVIQNGARMMSQGLFPGIRPLPINPIVSRTAAVRSVLSLLSIYAHFSTHYMIDRFISQSESCLDCSALAHILSLPLTLLSLAALFLTFHQIRAARSLQTSAQSLIRAKAPLLHAWCDMNNWSQTQSFFNGMTKHTDWLSYRETFISWASETGRPSGTAC